MRKHAPILATLASSILMVSCAAPSAGAKEQTRMSALQKETAIPFHDPAVVPMADAILAGDSARIRALAAKTDLAARGDDGVTLLEWAIWTQQPRALATLLEAGADPSLPGMNQETVAHMAAAVEPPEYLRILIEHKAPVDLPSPRGGRTPIFSSVQNKRDPQTRMLIDAGADTHRIDSMGNTLLHQAALANDGTWVLEFLELGVDPRAVNAQRSTFQPYFFMTKERLLNAQAREQRAAVEAWLASHRIPRE